jgi:electron transfer flavoprotein beta subunit
MHILVLLAGIADPKRPLPRPAGGDWRAVWDAPGLAYKLSPFDEAALEIALKMRSADAGTSLTVLVAHGAHDESLLRAIAAFRPDRLSGLALPAADQWDTAAVARHVRAAMSRLETPFDLALIGREFGDADDGMLPPYLAESLDLPFVGLALNVMAQDGKRVFQRSGGDMDESITLAGPALASISNHKGNRLRHPLFKNVVHAKQQKFTAQPSQIDAGPTVTLAAAEPAGQKARGNSACRVLAGSLQEQAGVLADYLKAATKVRT